MDTTSKPKKKPKFLFIVLIFGLLGAGNVMLWQSLQSSQRAFFVLQEEVKKQRNDVIALSHELEKIANASKDLVTEAKQDKVHFDDVLLKEAESLIRLAEARMVLLQDKDLAVSLLKLADQRLAAVTAHSVQAPRSALAKDIETIAALQLPDETTLFHRLNLLQVAIQDFKFSALKIEKSPLLLKSEETKQKSFMTSLMGLVSIHRHEQAFPRPLSSETAEILKRSILTDLDIAKAALMYQNDALYHEALLHAGVLVASVPLKEAALAPLQKEIQSLNEIALKRAVVSFQSLAVLMKQ